MKKYTEENLINKLSLFKEGEVSFLLGAGCSINSGCMASDKLISEFKKRLYCAKNGLSLNSSTLIDDKGFKQILDNEYCCEDKNPYSYYFEMCFPDPLDRSKFIKENFLKVKPSYGYLCFANYLIANNIKTVVTTNFDRLVGKAINKLDDTYDFTNESDTLLPKISSKLNILEAHGDYNYDLLRNTDDELKTLSSNVLNAFVSINCKEFIVLGYSGMDESIMQALDAISKKGTKIIWCVVDERYSKNERIDKVLSNNPDSGYCYIDGFDELFIKLYKFTGEKNKVIDEEFKRIKNDDFELTVSNKPETIQFNANKLINNPCCYKTKRVLTDEKIKEINEQNLDCFVMTYKDSLYLIGDENKLKEMLRFAKLSFDYIAICNEDIPVSYRCKLIKEIIRISFRCKGMGVFKDNIFIQSGNTIKEGIEISVDIFNGNIVLLTNVNYFSLIEPLPDDVKVEINRLKSNLYPIKNYNKRNELFKTLFGGSLKFIASNSVVEFENKYIDTKDDSHDIYNCSAEPELIVDNNCSVNQIKLLNEYGPRTTLFSVDTVKVGVICAEEDKNKLKNYLNLLLTGTGVKQAHGSVIPEYRGFVSTFKKQIEIDYNHLPSFHIRQLLNSEKMNIYKFRDFCLRGIKKLYDETNVDIVLLYISNSLAIYRNDCAFDLHDAIKLSCANRYKTQFIEESSIDSKDDINKKIFNLAIGIYTKTIGMPWYPKNYSKNTLFLGMSFGRDANNITVGCSQVFDGAGRGMQLIISQISDKNRKNQYLSLEEAYNLGTKIRTTYYRTSKTDILEKIVIHRCNPFRKEEIEGFKKAFEGIDDFDLIQISDCARLNCYSFKNDKCHGYPVKRGTIVKSAFDTAYVWTDGSVVSADILNGNTYRNNKRGMGRPIKIKKYHGNISVNEVVNDLMYLTKMDFNSSDIIYSKFPVTIKYSQVVCDLLKQGQFADELISFEYIM